MKNGRLTAEDIFGVPDVDHAELAREVLKERVRREVKRLVDAENRRIVEIPPAQTLRERLARPQVATQYRVEGWQPLDTRVMLSAQFKAGKTTARDNLVRCLVDGDPFLGQYAVTPVNGTVAIIDFEMSDRQLDVWLREQGIQHADRVVVFSLRGRAGAFNIIEPDVRSEWARLLRSHGVVYPIVDNLRPILDALGLDEHRDAGRFLVAFDALLTEADITEAMTVHHMGHTGERSRGDSRLRDWPDVEWRMMRRDDNPASPRFITAFGRDVDIPESQVEYDGATRRLTVTGGSRQDAKDAGVLNDVIAILNTEAEPISGREIKRRFKAADSEHSKDAIDKALRYGTKTDALHAITGPRNSILYSSVRVSGSVRPVSQDSQPSVPVSGGLYKARTLGHSREEAADGHLL